MAHSCPTFLISSVNPAPNAVCGGSVRQGCLEVSTVESGGCEKEEGREVKLVQLEVGKIGHKQMKLMTKALEW